MYRQMVVSMPWAFIFLLLVQSGCVKVGPDYVRPEVRVSPTWLESEDPRVKQTASEYSEWWRAFNDPVLDKLIDTAYRQNLSLSIAGVRVLEARAQLGVVVGRLFPQTQQAFGSLEYNRLSRNSALGSFGAGGGAYFQDQIGITASWEIDFWGKFRRAIESADAAWLASVADYDSTLVSLTSDVANNYILIRTLEKRIDIARRNVQTQGEGLRIAEARFKAGATSERDVQQAATVLNSTESIIPGLRAQLQQAQHALSVLLGLPPSDLRDLLGGSSEIPVAPPEIAVGIPADLLRRRPDVRGAEYQAMAQAAQIGVARADLFPAFSLSGTFSFLSTNVGSSSLADMFQWSSRSIVAGPTLEWNIFNYGQITNHVRLQDARFQELLIRYQNTVLGAQQEVEDGLSAFLRAQEQAEFLARSARSAEASLGFAVSQYRGGAVDFTTVLSAQQALLNEQDNLVSTLGNISRSVVAIYRAIGGGWEVRGGTDIVPPEVKEAMAKRTNWGDLLRPSVYLPLPSGEERPSLVRAPDW
jgi:NodT family efflux transporter outer membrane factor (OMF) lipoprotein